MQRGGTNLSGPNVLPGLQLGVRIRRIFFMTQRHLPPYQQQSTAQRSSAISYMLWTMSLLLFSQPYGARLYTSSQYSGTWHRSYLDSTACYSNPTWEKALRSCADVFSLRVERAFCSTTSGVIGWVPKHARKGDKVCMLDNCKMPVVIPPKPAAVKQGQQHQQRHAVPQGSRAELSSHATCLAYFVDRRNILNAETDDERGTELRALST